LYNSFAPQTLSVEPEPKCHAPASPSKSFWFRLQPSKIAWALAPQPWLEHRRLNKLCRWVM